MITLTGQIQAGQSLSGQVGRDVTLGGAVGSDVTLAGQVGTDDVIAGAVGQDITFGPFTILIEPYYLTDDSGNRLEDDGANNLIGYAIP